MILSYHPDCLLHDTGTHPENRRRVETAKEELERLGEWRGVERPGEVERELLHRVHPESYVAELEEACRDVTDLGPDTVCGPGSVRAALLAAGAAESLADAAVAGEHGFGLVRPPGHHALPMRAMGFCLLNNAAVAAERALDSAGRVAVVDLDVHHGNGTQEIFYDRSDVLYLSVHRGEFYPGTGSVDETGRGDGEGYTVNVPLRGGATDGDYAHALREVVLPALDRFGPDAVVVSAGYDAHRSDPLGGMALTAEVYGHLFRELSTRWAVAALLEGGYDPDGLAASVAASAAALRGEEFDVAPDPRGSTREAVSDVRRVHGL